MRIDFSKHNVLKEYRKRIAEQTAFPDQNKKVTHGQGYIKEKYWFGPNGEVFPVEREHGDQAMFIARELELISPDKSISDYGFKSRWELAKALLLDKGWLRVQVYEAKTIGCNALPGAIGKKSTEEAVFKVLRSAREFFFQENWPYTLEYRTNIHDYKRYGWKKMIKVARNRAIQIQNEEKAMMLRYRTA